MTITTVIVIMFIVVLGVFWLIDYFDLEQKSTQVKKAKCITGVLT